MRGEKQQETYAILFERCLQVLNVSEEEPINIFECGEES